MKFQKLFATTLSCSIQLTSFSHIYFLPFWTKRIHCNTKQALWLNGKNKLKTLSAQIKLKSLRELSHVSHLRLAVYFPTPDLGQFAMSLVRIWTRKMIAASKVFNNNLIFYQNLNSIDRLDLHKSKSIRCSNINKSAFPLSTSIFHTSLQDFSAYWDSLKYIKYIYMLQIICYLSVMRIITDVRSTANYSSIA